MRGFVLYSRCRRLPWAVAALVLVGAVASLVGAVYVGRDEFGDMALLPTVVLGPLPAAALILVTIDEPSMEIALAGWRNLQRWRLGHVAALVAIPIVAYLPLATHSGMAWGYPSAIRNLFGYLGIGLAVGAIWGAKWAWAGPLLYGMGGFLLEAQIRSESLLYWPARPDGEVGAWIIVVGFAALGTVLISRRRIGGMIDDDEAQ